MPDPTFGSPPDARLFPPLPAGSALHVCLICGGVMAAKAVQFHDEWHRAVSAESIAAQRRLDALEGGTHG